MCLIIFAHQYHPQYKLVVAANRDEFYERPTLPAAYWQDNPHIIAGRDLSEGGTWMGITTKGRFAALTNYRDPANHKEAAPSRGHLVHQYLNSTLKPQDYLANIDAGGTKYNGFNLLVGDLEALFYYSNREELIREVPPGVHGLSNALLNDPWPKVEKGIKNLTNTLEGKTVNVESLFTMMANQEMAEDKDLPNTGVSLEMERMLAPSFVTSSNYGTRVSTVILVTHDNNMKFWERTFINHQPDKWEEVYYEINV